MKVVATLLAALCSSAIAAPAIVWSAEKGSANHSSEAIDAKTVISSAIAGSDSSLSNVVFVVERDQHGSEGLSVLTTSGDLPKVSSKYGDASSVHHYVRGIENVKTLAKAAEAAAENVVEVSLKDFKVPESSNADKAAVSVDGSISGHPELIVVEVPASATPADIDAAVTSAIEDTKVGSVILTAVRGVSEVKLEREANSLKNFYEMQQKSSRRRLDEDGGNNGGNYNNEGIYFVNFTPNIFAGLLFFVFFLIITYIGLGCMNMISGQDVYVSKYPTIGREV